MTARAIVSHVRRVNKADVVDTLNRIVRADKMPTRNDFSMLLVSVREHLADSTLLRDLAHSVAHGERVKGYAFNYVKTIVAEMRASVASGATFQVKNLYPIRTIIGELNEVLSRQGFVGQIDPDVERIRKVLAFGIADALDGTTFEIDPTARGVMHAGRDTDGAVTFNIVLEVPDLMDATGEPGVAGPWLLSKEEQHTNWDGIVPDTWPTVPPALLITNRSNSAFTAGVDEASALQG